MKYENIRFLSFHLFLIDSGKARIRVQLSASHSEEDVNRAVDAFIEIGQKLKVVS